MTNSAFLNLDLSGMLQEIKARILKETLTQTKLSKSISFLLNQALTAGITRQS